jgi:hypothetical protein
VFIYGLQKYDHIKAAYVYYSYTQKKKMFYIEFKNPKWGGGNFTPTSPCFDGKSVELTLSGTVFVRSFVVICWLIQKKLLGMYVQADGDINMMIP